MEISEMLKSNDEEIIILYADLALEKYSVNEVNTMIKNKKYSIYVNNGNFYLRHQYMRSNARQTKLNFTFKK